ncbi:MAG TPA: integrase core domain-containing protein [Nitrospirota bacterium]
MARVSEGLAVSGAMKLLGLSRTSYYRQVRGMTDYSAHARKVVSTEHAEVLREVALKRVEAGHRRVRAYAMAWGKLLQETAGSSRMSCYRVLKREGLIQPKRIGRDLREAAERRRQMLKAPGKLNEVLQGDFTDYVTEDGEKYRIGCVTEYLSRYNLVSEVLDTETALDLIAVTEAALKEIVALGHDLPAQVILVTDNGPAMKSRRFRSFVKKTKLLIHVRSRNYHPQTIGREERYHGSLKLEHLYRLLPNNRSELIEAVANYRRFYNYERLHMSLGYRTPAAVYLTKDGQKL